MKKFIKSHFRYFFSSQKEALRKMITEQEFFKNNITEYILKKYIWHFVIILALIFLSLLSKFLPLMFNKTPSNLSLDHLIPKGFVLIPIEISNHKDIMNIIGAYGVVDLYAYSKETGLPEIQTASVLKIIPPETEEGDFIALVPEKEAIHLFNYSEPFYAVIQNPNKRGAKIYKKKKKKSLLVIEDNF